MFIVFEGIDGSGKTTLSNRVARELRRAGLSVRHVREDGRLASPVSEGLRRFTRDPLHLALTPVAELLLYAAREAQLLEEVTRPALAEHDVVIADRFLYTAEVLARFGRGLPEAEVRPVLDTCQRGLHPDRVFLIDVDPAIARARRRASKLLAKDRSTPSRKGLTGAGLQARLRAGYRALAAAHPERWSVVENTDVPLDEQVTRLVEDVLRARRGEAPLFHAGLTRPTVPVRSLPEARGRFLARLDGWTVDEPGLAAWFLAGMEGQDVEARRALLAERCPELIAHGLAGLTHPRAWEWRQRLEAAAPEHVLASLTDDASDAPEAWRLRERWEHRAPEAVATSLTGLDSERAWLMRDRLSRAAPEPVMESLSGLDSARAWNERWRWLSSRGGDAAFADEGVARALCRSLRGVDSERAWEWRERAMAVAPDAVLRSLEGLDSPRAWALREQHAARAPKAVIGSLMGLDVPAAWKLREAFGVACEEVLDSLTGMDVPAAWRLRAVLADTWPSATVKSLGLLAATARGQALTLELLERHPHDFALLRQAARTVSQVEEEPRHGVA
ncbi:hypothetical protein KH5H1_40900 [Corallococcus caeni]|uniref:dTMP kinase n=1 Tax=Corallococcus caeni TaxID=3082388 RepID=UPI00295601E0|nr:hypothetical protein KH5H1_40900 [Corallococcus sp. KH5-1]